MPGILGRVVVLVAVLALATAGLCFFDRHEVGTGLCLVLAVTLALPLVHPLPVVGRLRPIRMRTRPVYALDFRAPPPRA